MEQIEVEIYYNGVEMKVIGDYKEPEPEVFYDNDMGGYPGSSAEFEVQQVLVGGNNITDLIAECQFQLIANAVLKFKENE